MWQNLLRHYTVFTETSEGFAPYYLAGIRHDMRQTTCLAVIQAERRNLAFKGPDRSNIVGAPRYCLQDIGLA